MPQISVILPNYNYAKYLSRRIESILNQTYTDFELIILDDASTDNSREVIEKYNDSRISVYFNEINTGNPFMQWDNGVKLAKGKYIWIAEADDYCENNLLETLFKLIITNEDTGIAFCNSQTVDKRGNNIDTFERANKFHCNNFQLKGTDYVIQQLVYQNNISNASAVLFNKEIYLQSANNFQNIEKCGDWFLWINMLQESNVAYTSEKLNYFRRHSESVIKSTDKSFHFYNLKMRRRLSFSENKIKMKNKSLQHNDLGELGLWQIQNKNVFTGIVNILKASILNFSFKYLRRLPYIIQKTRK